MMISLFSMTVAVLATVSNAQTWEVRTVYTNSDCTGPLVHQFALSTASCTAMACSTTGFPGQSGQTTCVGSVPAIPANLQSQFVRTRYTSTTVCSGAFDQREATLTGQCIAEYRNNVFHSQRITCNADGSTSPVAFMSNDCSGAAVPQAGGSVGVCNTPGTAAATRVSSCPVPGGTTTTSATTTTTTTTMTTTTSATTSDCCTFCGNGFWCPTLNGDGSCSINNGACTCGSGGSCSTSASSCRLRCPALTTSPPNTVSSTTTPSSSSSNPCFHEDTVIEYKGQKLTLKQMGANLHSDCVVPHIVSSQGVVIAAMCGSVKKVLRLTNGHLVFTQRGLVAASELTKQDTVFSDLEETSASACDVVSVSQEPRDQRYFGLNCMQSVVLANGLKTSTFEKLHTLPSVWMRVVGRVLGIHTASALGDRIATAASSVGLI